MPLYSESQRETIIFHTFNLKNWKIPLSLLSLFSIYSRRQSRGWNMFLTFWRKPKATLNCSYIFTKFESTILTTLVANPTSQPSLVHLRLSWSWARGSSLEIQERAGSRVCRYNGNMVQCWTGTQESWMLEEHKAQNTLLFSLNYRVESRMSSTISLYQPGYSPDGYSSCG